MKFFDNVKNLDELKAEYRRLCMKHHPDRGGDTATMQEINRQHDELFEILKAKHNAAADADKTGRTQRTTETPEEFRDIIEKLITLDGLEVELCGCWLWIGGNTREHKDTLKDCGCRWSKNKNMWYWHHAEDGAKWRKGKRTSIDEIRSKYGSQMFSKSGDEYGGYTRIGATA